MTLSNVNAQAGTMLLGLGCVRELMTTGLTAEEALVRVIEEEIASIAYLPDGRLLSEVLASDGRALLKAGERQARAGQVYYLGDRVISAETIRHGHQPKALRRLARRIIRREQQAQETRDHE